MTTHRITIAAELAELVATAEPGTTFRLEQVGQIHLVPAPLVEAAEESNRPGLTDYDFTVWHDESSADAMTTIVTDAATEVRFRIVVES